MTPIQTETDTNAQNLDPIKVVKAKVVEDRLYGEEHESRKGTKHFRANSKVFIIDAHWGSVNAVTVVGHHRGNGKYAKLDMPIKHLEQFALQVVYSPKVLELIMEHFKDREPYTEAYGEELLKALPGWKELWK